MSYYLPRIVGLSVAADWMLTGRTVSADEAYHRGLVSELVDDDQLLERALELASQIAAHSPLGVQMTKRALQMNTDAPDLSAAIERGEPQPGHHPRHRGGCRGTRGGGPSAERAAVARGSALPSTRW